MKLLFMSVAWIGAMWMPGRCAAAPSCAVSVEPGVEIQGNVIKLSDLVKADACPDLFRAAEQVHLGAVPLPSSVRVLEGTEIVARLRHLAAGIDQAVVLDVPARITVRQAGRRWSCREIAARLLPGAAAGDDCGAGGRVPQSASLEFVRQQWDPAAGTWNLVVRCRRSSDCVPFLIRLPGILRTGFAPPVRSRKTSSAVAIPAGAESAGEQGGPVVVRRGGRAILVWDQEGIRLVAPCLALEEGRQGETVRVRTLRGGRVLRAVVVGAGTVRVE